MFKQKILNKKSGILTYGMTPPKAANSPERIAEIAQLQIDRLKELDIDALILYDVQEEAERVDQERTFPYLPTIDPATYSDHYLSQLEIPRIIYRCVGNYTETQFKDWIKADINRDKFSVYVGASSSKQEVKLDLPSAYTLSKQLNNNLTFGGVIIPERHILKNDEHIRVVNKIKQGCDFFVTQATYNVEASKNLLSDLYYHCTNNGIEMVPIIFNLAPCGSTKTLEFMKWLGISIPKWLENELKYTNDLLDKSIHLSRKIFEELLDFGLEKGIPIGCSIESVSTRKSEIEASIQLMSDIKELLDKKMKKVEFSVR
ncbi:methylenetetrahydrofolate reductase [Paenibacillus sp. NEAU-GSW1]|uniref:methylenetetrahydrofolate reductase n=1 Tax=Paenibacillus sp. NEAU-GSW1 TaxID=2682486 RepID=UPI0012E254AA|nr:methylenetetrahydrofolate reductase [Paenibacillus sp. NEAU-GSW1]MUT68361.1 5,10-methylenetetrahydrofolate reductase [Paenibacillus sp. NEAU-GSW1]